MAHRIIIIALILISLFLSFCNVLQEEELSREEREVLADQIVEQGYHYRQGSEMSMMYLDSAINICPWCAWHYRSKAVWYVKSGRFKKHYSILDKAVELDSMILSYRGKNQKINRNHQGVVDDLVEFDKLTEDPDDHSNGKHLYLHVGGAQLSLHDYKDAEESYSRVIKYQIKNGFEWVDHNAYLGRGIARLAQQKLESGLGDLDTCLLIYAECAEAAFFKGKQNLLSGDKQSAKKHLELAKKNIANLQFKENFGISEDSIFLALKALKQ